MEQNYVTHAGIKGMKWGVRRYQNPDGSLTPAGQKRYNRKADRARKKDMRGAVKNRRLLSDEELDQRIRRLEKEKKLRDLTDSEINRGRKEVGEVLANSGKQVATTTISGATKYGVKVALTKKFDAKDAADYIVPKPKSK